MHGIEIKIAMQRWVSMCAAFVFACYMYMYAFVGVLSMVYMHSWSCCCRGFVEAYRDLLELVCEAWERG